MTLIQSVFTLLLLRHGNTFRPQDRVLWLGARDDIPLTAAGEAQIRLAAQYMSAKGLSPSVIYCAPAARTYTSARLVQNLCPTVQTIEIDSRLDELDYGGWIGLTNEEIGAQFDRDALGRWLETGEWPHGYGWKSSEKEVVGEVLNFLDELLKRHAKVPGSVLVVSTNSRLRYFLKVISGAFEAKAAKNEISIRTGHLAQMRWVKGEWQLGFWNLQPIIKAKV